MEAPMTPVGGGNGRGAGETTAGSPIQDPPPRQSTVADGEHPPGGKRRRMRHFLYRILTRLGVHTVLHSDAPAPTRLEGVEEKSVPEEDEATLQIRWVNPRWKQGYRSDAGQDSVSCPISNSHKTTYWTRKNADEPISAQGRQRESTNQRARRNHFYMRPVNWKPGSKQLEIPALRKYPLRGFDQLLQTSPQGHQPSSPADKPPTPGMGQLLQTSPVNHLEQTLLRKKQPPMPTDKHQPLETVRREHLLMAMDKHLQTSPKDQPLQTAQKDQPLWTTQKDKPLHTPQNNQTMLQTLPQKDQLPQTLRKEHLLMPTNKPLQTPQKDQLQQTLLPCTDDGIQALQPTLEQPSQEPRTSHHTTVLLNALTNKIQTLSNSWGKRVALLTEHQTS
ncbi:unnamed protein product [Cyprideis torosa]|uniref:Uncharacterized protein n=1 Tax=Cyprideis torosa TaxID=163714 RepID=A0A7R8W8Q2_9CRUS|nr:unnamed protein product [Cyprideis torosa]CAG0888812.1 unnamed protein product [Cyprideis torosa]